MTNQKIGYMLNLNPRLESRRKMNISQASKKRGFPPNKFVIMKKRAYYRELVEVNQAIVFIPKPIWNDCILFVMHAKWGSLWLKSHIY